ncbi:hypothetical protein ACTXT7_001152 [Hymenolepis weldensis]
MCEKGLKGLKHLQYEKAKMIQLLPLNETVSGVFTTTHRKAKLSYFNYENAFKNETDLTRRFPKKYLNA